MGNYENLKQSITEVIRTNGNQEITGAVLQSTLLTIISTVGANATFAGIATPTTNPGTPDGSVFWLASESGTYSNFGNIELQDGLSVLMWNGSWRSQQILSIDDVPTAGSDNLVKSGGVQEELALGAVYDVSAKNPTAGPNNDGKFDSLSALLGDANLDTLIPASSRKGGMSIRFIQSSNNEYVQYRLMSEEFSTDTEDWTIADEGTYVENPEFIYVKTDTEGKILWAIKIDGGIYYGVGVPQQVIDYIEQKIADLSLDEYEDIVTFLSGLLEGDEMLQNLLNEKVDKEEGKSLIDEEYASAQSAINNSEFLKVVTDANGKIICGIKAGGTKVVNTPIDTPSFAADNIDNPEWMFVLTDKQGKILGGRHRNGEVKEYIGITTKKLLVEEDAVIKGDVHYDEIPTQIKEYVDGSVVVQEQMPNYLQLSRQSDNIINTIGYDSFLDKAMVVVAPDKYSSWSRLGVVGDTLICMYCRGLQHEDPNKGQLYVALSANGIIWTPKKLVIDTPDVRDGVTGGGNDENGNMLFIDRVGTPVGSSTYHEIYRTTDGINYEKIVTLPSSVNLGHCGDIVNIPTRGLMAFFGCYGTQADYGYILSNDNGATWSRIVIENVAMEERPMEMSAAYIGDGKILVVGRYEGSGNSHMWQLQSEDYGETWIKAATNISGNSNTPSIIYDNETQKLSLYIYNRANGHLEYRECAIGDIWDNPTNWTSPAILAYGAIGQDAGNVTTCVFKGHQIVSWYSGNAVDTGIYNLIKS